MSIIISNPTNMNIKRVIVKQTNAKSIVISNLTGGTKIVEFRRRLKDQEGEKFENAILAYAGKQITKEDDTKILADFGIKSDSTLNVIFRVLGGSCNQIEGLTLKKLVTTDETINDGPRRISSSIKKIPKDAKLANKPCCVLQTLPEKNTFHIEMSCNHVISSEGILAYLTSAILHNNEFVIKCPITGCNHIWNVDTCMWAARVTPEEEAKFLNALNMNMIKHPTSKIRECPSCGAFLHRPNTMNQNRVGCPVCQKQNWCWCCGQTWISIGNDKCGNLNCSYDAQITNILMNCDKKTISNIPNVPTVRLCTQCTILIEWQGNCKHMKCPICTHEFCFSCLKKWSEVGANHLAEITSEKCPVHPIQKC